MSSVAAKNRKGREREERERDKESERERDTETETEIERETERETERERDRDACYPSRRQTLDLISMLMYAWPQPGVWWVTVSVV